MRLSTLPHRTTNDSLNVPTRYIALDRRFVPYTREDAHDSQDFTRLLDPDDGTSTWPDLLARRRVVVLAEPGSGKTAELEEQTRRLRAAGKFSFYATLQNVGRFGFDGAVRAPEQLNAWRGSADAGWFFLDSVDEAKGAQIRLRDALDAVAVGISGAVGRAHIVLSGRHTDWEFRSDLEQLTTILPLPPPDDEVAPIDANALIVQFVRKAKPARSPPPPAELPCVVVMEPLDQDQVQRFAQAKGVTDIDAFSAALDKADLWRFARRPLDLEWLVDEWRSRRQFGPYRDMLERSLRHRLRESDSQRARQDSLSIDDAFKALERIGAALILEKIEYLQVPDTAIDLTEGRSGLKLGDVLPDWSDHQTRFLLNRAVLDPVVSGLVRLHHDNEGSVRSFLTARWLQRLLHQGCPKQTVADLLFATTYDVQVILPSMRETAAWLALSDADTANEILRREPRLLMNAGDPASLPLPIRERVLHAAVLHAKRQERLEYFNEDQLQRFSRPDLSPTIRALWRKHESSPAIRGLLLLMIALGDLKDCADLAIAAAFAGYADRRSQRFAGRALIAVAPDAERRRYAEHLLANADSVEPTLIWDAVERLFPKIISVDALVALVGQLDVEHARHAGFDALAAKLADRLDDARLIERLASGLIAQLDLRQDALDESNDARYTAIEACGLRILELIKPDQASDVAMEIVLLLSRRGRHRRRHDELHQAIFASPHRRRAMLWYAARWFADDPHLQGKPVTEYWQFRGLGFPLDLQHGDIEWLLRDAATRETPAERALAADTAIELGHIHSRTNEVLDKLRAIADRFSEVAAVIGARTTPKRRPAEDRASQKKWQDHQRRTAIEQAKAEASWVAFADSLRANPDQLRALKPPTEKGIDWRLFNLWKLLSSIGENRSRHAIDNLDVLSPLFDASVRSAAEEAFVQYWRHWKPRVQSGRLPNERNLVYAFDNIGIVGVTLEAARSAQWAQSLDHAEAVRAAEYATLELNGFPAWLVTLARAQPDAVREVLTRELRAELTMEDPNSHPDVLQDIQRDDGIVGGLVADYLFQTLRDSETLRPQVLNRVLDILSASRPDTAYSNLLLDRIDRVDGRGELATYLEHLFRVAPKSAQLALTRRLAQLDPDAQTRLLLALLPRLAGNGYDIPQVLQDLPFDALQGLVRIAYRAVRIEDDHDHSDQDSYTPDERDDAESARSALLRFLVDTPGLATCKAIQRFRKDRSVPIGDQRLADLALQRAATDSEHASWTSADVVAFEHDHLTAPRTTADLQRVLIRRLEDLQHDLINADFPQGPSLARAPAEVDVQIAIAHLLRERQGRSYSVEREPHVVDEKEPDVRARAKVTDASVPIEIKLAERWSLPELENALSKQLIGRYLRSRDSRHGILLLVHQRKRGKGWQSRNGRWLTISDVVKHLRSLALRAAAKDPYAPQATVVLIDVSSVQTARRRNARSSRKTKGGKKSASKPKSPNRAKRAKGKTSTKKKTKSARPHATRRRAR